MPPQAPRGQPWAGEQPAPWTRTLSGHERGVCSVAVMADGRHALSGSEDETIRLWDLETGDELRRFGGRLGIVLSVAALADGQRALSGSFDRLMRLWDLKTGVELCRFAGHSNWIEAVAVLPDGRRGLSCSGDRTMRLWDLQTGAELHRFEGHGGTIASVAALPDGRRALSGSHDHTARLWDLATGVELRRLEGHERGINAVAVLPDGRRALSGSADRTMRLWDLESGSELRRFEGHASPITSVALPPDGRRAFSGGEDGTVRLWDVGTGAGLAEVKAQTSGVGSLAALSDGRQVLIGLSDGTLRLRQFESETAITGAGQIRGMAGAGTVTIENFTIYNRAIDEHIREEPESKRRVRYFVSFSREDERLKDDLLRRLQAYFGASAKYLFDGWQDELIDLGSDWHRQIQAAIAECDFGLLLVSPAFLGNEYIKKHELSHFVGDEVFRPEVRKRTAPVALRPLRFDGSMDLRGLAQRQIFHDARRRAYQELTGIRKDRFAEQLYAKIVEMLEKGY